MKNLTLLGLLAALLLVTPHTASAQYGAYTENGFGIGAGISTSDNQTALGATTGYVFASAFEIGVNLARSNADGLDLSVTGIGPYVAVYPVRQSADFPLSVALTGTYTFRNYSGDAYDQLQQEGIDISGNGGSVQAGLFHAFNATDTFQLIPYLGAGYRRDRFEISAGGRSEDNTEESTFVTVSASLLFQTSPATYFALTPQASFGEGDSSFGASVSLTLPQ